MTKTNLCNENVQPFGAMYSNKVKYSKQIGSTTYVVSVHFSKNKTETLEDKILRLIESEASISARYS